MGRRKRTPSADEEHARLLLAEELGVEFKHHDDGSEPLMPDLLSFDGKHAAEVITTARSTVREAGQRLRPVPNTEIPHCVRVMIPYAILGGASKVVRGKIVTDVIRWTATVDHAIHWSHGDDRLVLPGAADAPILALGRYDDGVQVVCVRECRHLEEEPHQVEWSVGHEPSRQDPWSLIRQSLRLVDEEQHGGVDALARKLDGFPNRHLVMYPFGPPGNLTAAFTRYVVTPNSFDLMPPLLAPPLTDVHLWLLYHYDAGKGGEGLHMCTGRWARFGTAMPSLDASSPLGRLHYRDH